MQAMTYTELRQNLAKTLKTVIENHEPILIARNKEEDCVLISLSHYQSLEETAYLLRSPANATRLLHSIEQLRNHQGQERALEE